LDKVSLPYELIFFDGTDEEQRIWAISQYDISENKPLLILTGGAPIELEKQEKKDFYFDQGGSLTAKLGIKAVPAVVSQHEKSLLIREIKLSGVRDARIS